MNRGFLHGPLLPIYGSGAILILFVTLPVEDSLVLIWLLGMLAMGLRLAPATAVLRSAWPVHAIWQANMHAIPLPRDLGPQDVLITRPAFDPVPERLPPGGAAIIAALQAGAALADAHAASPDADLGAIFTLLLRTNAIAALTEAR